MNKTSFAVRKIYVKVSKREKSTCNKFHEEKSARNNFLEQKSSCNNFHEENQSHRGKYQYKHQKQEEQ